MVKDNVNLYFNNLLTHLREKYKAFDGGQSYNPIPPAFPYMYFKQIGGATAASTLSNTEDGVNLDIEIKFYTNKTPNEVRKIANTAREYMIDNGFRCNYFSPVENVSDASISQFLVRFSKLET